MNRKSLITILVIVVIVFVTAIVYFTITKNINQPVTLTPKVPAIETKIVAINYKTNECKEFQSINDMPNEWTEIKEFKSCEEVELRMLNTQKISDIHTIRTALEIYYADNQKYPQNLSLLLPKYLSKNESLIDPKTKEAYFYAQLSNGKDYHLGAKLDEEDNAAMNALKTDADFDSTGFNGFNGKDPIYDRTSLR